MLHASCVTIIVASLLLLIGCASVQRQTLGEAAADDSHRIVPQPRRPVATFSIVARDPATGELGVAVQSHWFSVGSVVPWAQAGVGAVATQSLVDPTYGPLGLHLMSLGRSAPDALKGLVASDDGRALRQVAMIDAGGKVAAHTGDRCIADAGMVVDAKNQFSVQANLMANDKIWPAMAEAYRNAKGDLAERMLAALDAAQGAGGDIRGRQSAAILIVNSVSTGKPWADRKFDLRVEDHPEPLKELRRLVQIQRAYLHMNAGDAAVEKNDFDLAGKEYAAAEEFAPQIVEVEFWHAVTLAKGGKVEEALPIFRKVFEREPVWAELVPKLVKPDLLPNDRKVLYRIHAQYKDVVDSFWEARLGQSVTLDGTVPIANAKMGPALVLDSFPYRVDIKGDEWPSNALGKRIRITGKVMKGALPLVLFDSEKDPDKGKARPAPIRIPDGEDKPKAELWFWLSDVRWELVEK